MAETRGEFMTGGKFDGLLQGPSRSISGRPFALAGTFSSDQQVQATELADRIAREGLMPKIRREGSKILVLIDASPPKTTRGED
jgi:hypothetical protein